MSHWSYRIIKSFDAKMDNVFYGLHEVYYSDSDRVEGWTEDAITVGDTPEEIVKSLQLMLKDAKRDIENSSVLDEQELTRRPEPDERAW